MIDLAAITGAVFARLETDAAGADVRNAFGAATVSVMHAEDLRVEGLTVQALPARPIVALRRGAAPGEGNIVYRPVYTWYCYDDPSVGYGRLELLLPLIGAAYEAGLLSVAHSGIGDVESVSIGAQTRDDRLKLLLCPLTLVVGAV